MNGQVFPLFEHAHILRTSMLTELRDYAYEYGRLLYEGFGDGIVSGCRIAVNDGALTVGRGVIRYRDNLYLMTEPISVSYAPTDVWTVCKLEFKDEIRREGYICREIGVDLTNRLALCDAEMELCRFKLKTGARLRMAYVDFADRNTEFDTVNTIYAPFAAVGESSLSPEITRAFAKEAAEYLTEPSDIAFCMTAFGAARAMSRDAIALYAASRLQREFAAYDNMELFEMLCTILEDMKGDGARKVTQSRRKRRQMIVE